MIRFIRLHKKYNTYNKELGQTGAGIKSLDELNEDPRTKNLVGVFLFHSFVSRILKI